MNTIKVGVAGLGFIGPAHIEALRRIPGIEVVAVSETSEELAKSKAEQLNFEILWKFQRPFKRGYRLCTHLHSQFSAFRNGQSSA
jgi:predicted dehydrogenase